MQAWERVVFEFGQRRQLPALAPFVPTANPLLGATAYYMVLTSLVSRSSDHAQLLALLERWPPSIIKVDDLVQRTTQQLALMPEASKPPMLRVCRSSSFLAEISVKSRGKLFVFII